ncbi:hypothetical protein PybrP1_010489, partial [[Pythium] brassicae (nom. inval.)]
MSSTRAEDWDDWEEDAEAEEEAQDAARSPSQAPRSPVGSTPTRQADAGEDAWLWSLERIERDLARLPLARADASDGSAVIAIGSSDEPETEKLGRILQLADQAVRGVAATRERLAALDALALVAKLHLLAVQSAFGPELLPSRRNIDTEDASEIVERLRARAGLWGVPAPTEADEQAEQRKLHEMSALVHHALAARAGGDDLAPFQQVLEQLFASLPQRTLSVSAAWAQHRSAAAPARNERSEERAAEPRHAAYLAHVQALADPAAAPERVVGLLSDAQAFQDAKDIRRDELVLNGAFVSGALGYAAVVDRLQLEIQQTVRAHVGGAHRVGGPDVDEFADTTRAIAKQILNACNRTESGGSSYEVLSRFLLNHETDAIVIRPASAKAAPLQIRVDVGAFTETNRTNRSNRDEMWAFGVRVALSAVTWYLVCDADDPTSELYEVKTTYENRLAFPLGLTPFHPLKSMRKDCGVVGIQLVRPHEAAERRQDGTGEEAADFAEL